MEEPSNPSPGVPLCDWEVPQHFFFLTFSSIYILLLQLSSLSHQYLNFFLIYFIYNIIDCVCCCDGAFLALHVKFRYLVSSLALWDCFMFIPNQFIWLVYRSQSYVLMGVYVGSV